MVQAPSYRERADRLIGEVRDMFNLMSVEDGELISPLNDLYQRLWMVDSVERLGIDRHFQNEITSALDHVYRSVCSHTYPYNYFSSMLYMSNTHCNKKVIYPAAIGEKKVLDGAEKVV